MTLQSPVRRDPWPGVGLVATLAFVALLGLVVRDGLAAFDSGVTAAVQSLPIPTSWWQALTDLGGAILIPIGIGSCVGAVLTGHIRLAIIVAAVLLVATVSTDAVKDAVARPRPPGFSAGTLGYSFPSGHTLNSTTTYGLLALIAWRSRRPLLERRFAVAIGVIVPLLVGLSRIGLGVHFPSDVVGGWLAGITFVALGAVLIRRTGAMERDIPRRGTDRPAPAT